MNTVEHGVYVADATLALMKERDVSLVPTISAFQPPSQAENGASGASAIAAREREMAASVATALDVRTRWACEYWQERTMLGVLATKS